MNFSNRQEQHKIDRDTVDSDENSKTESEDDSVISYTSEDDKVMDMSHQPITSKVKSKLMRKKLSELAKICDQYESTDKAGAVIATAMLEDF